MEEQLPNRRRNTLGRRFKKSNLKYDAIRKKILKRYDFSDVLFESKVEFINTVNVEILSNLNLNKKTARKIKAVKVYRQTISCVEPIALRIGATVKCDIVKPRIRPKVKTVEVKPVEVKPTEIKKEKKEK